MQNAGMAISIDTLRALVDVDPFTQSYADMGEKEVFRRMDKAGLLPHLARHYDERGARDVLSDEAFQSVAGTAMERYFYAGKGDRYYLRADIHGRADGSKITEAAIKQVAKEDIELAREYMGIQQAQGSAAVFGLISASVRRHDLAQLATHRTQDLASPDEYMERRNRGRAM